MKRLFLSLVTLNLWLTGGNVLAAQAKTTAPCELVAHSSEIGRASSLLPYHFDLPPAAKLLGSHLPAFVLPCAGRIDEVSEQAGQSEKLPRPKILVNAQHPRLLDAGILVSDDEMGLAGQLDSLLDASLAKDEKAAKLDKAVSHCRQPVQKAIAQTKDAADYLISYRGFGPSSEAGDIALGENLQPRSRASSEYLRQKNIDDKHFLIVSCLMEMAMGVGTEDPARGHEITDKGLERLKSLVGEEEAAKSLSLLKEWKQRLAVPETVYKQGAWAVTERQEKLRNVVDASIASDPVISEIVRRLHKYNTHSQFSRLASSAIHTTLGLASLTPTFVGPAAKAALLSYVMLSGGPEHCKILKAMYLDKRFESRWKTINEEAHLAIENYQIGVLTRNPVLIAMSESLIEQMANGKTRAQVLGDSVITDGLN